MKYFVIPFCLCFQMTQAQGLIDGFFKGKGNSDAVISGGYQQFDQYRAGKKTIDFARTMGYVGLFYARGLTDRWDAGGSIPLINGKLQDISVYTKYRLLHKQGSKIDTDLFPAIQFSAPLTNYPTDIGQAIGQRAVVFSPKLVFQQRFNFGVFYQIQGGYNYALDPVPSSIPISAKIGWAGAKWYFDAWYDYQQGTGTADYLGSVPFSSFRELTVDYQRVGCTIYRGLKFKKASGASAEGKQAVSWGWALNGAYTFDGRNTGLGWSVGAALIMKLPKA